MLQTTDRRAETMDRRMTTYSECERSQKQQYNGITTGGKT